jgi:hypothetical protein
VRGTRIKIPLRKRLRVMQPGTKWGMDLENRRVVEWQTEGPIARGGLLALAVSVLAERDSSSRFGT